MDKSESGVMHLDEEKLIKTAKPYLVRCRDGDWNHSCRVVKWVKRLGQGRKDLPTLITAAYLHDIGWTDVVPKGKLDLDDMLKFEAKANINTPKLVREVLEKMEFEEDEIESTIRLIKAADRHESQTDDEAIIVDADNLSKLSLEHLKEKYKPESYRKLIDRWDRELSKRIKTEQGKEIYPKLLKKLKDEIEKTE